MLENGINRRELLKNVGVGLGATGTITTLGTGIGAAADRVTNLQVEGIGSGRTYYKIKITNGRNRISGGARRDSSDKIYNDGDHGVIDGYIDAGNNEWFRISQSSDANQDIRFVSIDGDLVIDQNKGKETPYLGYHHYEISGSGDYFLSTNYNDCLCGDGSSCEYTTNCFDINPLNWEPANDEYGRDNDISWVSGSVAGGYDRWTNIYGDILYMQLHGNITMKPF